MANFKNTFVALVTGKQTVPAASNGTGTVITTGKVVTGSGTLFHSQMRKGSWLVDIANDEIRVVDNVASDTEATLSNAFSSDLSSAAPSIISNTDLNIKTISVGIESGLTDGEIDGIVFGNGKTYVFTKSGDGKDGFKSFIDPIIIDGTSTVIDLTIER